MPEVASRLLGDPTSTENSGQTWRYRTKGSLAVHVGGNRGLVGTWFDWESGDQGGVLELIERELSCDRAAALDWLEGEELIPADRRRPTGAPPDRTRTSQEPGRGPQVSTSTPARTKEKDRQAIACANRLWADGIAVADTPGRDYLLKRWVCPRAGVDGFPDLPAGAVRWLSREAAEVRDPQTGERLVWLPENAAGALIFAFTDAAGDVVAVHFEALTATGELTPWTDREGQHHERFRRIRGRKNGAYIRLRRAGEGESILVIVEGPTDTLAAWWLWPNSAEVWSCGGTSGLGSVQPEDVTGFDTVALAADGDQAGQEATWPTAGRLLEAGIMVKKWNGRGGADPVDRLRERLQERAAIIEVDGQRPRAEAEAAVWAAMVDPEPLEEVTAADVAAGKARTLLRRFAEAARDPDGFRIAANLRTQLKDLVDPNRAGTVDKPDDLLLAVADRCGEDDLLAAIRAALGVSDDIPVFRTAAAALKDPEPVPVLQRNGGCGAILSAGEIAVLSGEGGAGKSTLAAQLAMTAARTDAATFAPAAGLIIQGGPVAFLSYEDRARRVADRLAAVERHLTGNPGDHPDDSDHPLHRVQIADMAGLPLFGVETGGRWGDHPEPLPAWAATWRYIGALEPRLRLVIIDPVGEAFAANSNELAGVRAFYGALRKAAEAVGCGVLLVAHSTKENRQKAKATPGAVAGSAAWTDAARGVLTLDREGKDPDNPVATDPFKLRLVKANYAGRFALTLKAWTSGNGALVGFHETEKEENGSTSSSKHDPNDWEV